MAALALGSGSLRAQAIGISVGSAGPAFATQASLWLGTPAFGPYAYSPYWADDCSDFFYDRWSWYRYDPWYRPACGPGWASSLWWGSSPWFYPGYSRGWYTYQPYAYHRGHQPHVFRDPYRYGSLFGVSVGIHIGVGSWWNGPYAGSPFHTAYGWYGWNPYPRPVYQTIYVNPAPRWVVSPTPRTVRTASSTQFSSGAWVPQAGYKEDPRVAQQRRVATSRSVVEEGARGREVSAPRPEAVPPREAVARSPRQTASSREADVRGPETQALVNSRPARPPVVVYGTPSSSTREERSVPSTRESAGRPSQSLNPGVERTPDPEPRKAAPRASVVTTPRASSRPAPTQVQAPPTRPSAERRASTTTTAPSASVRKAAPSRAEAPSRVAAPSRSTSPSKTTAPSRSAAPSRASVPSRSSAPARSAPARSAPATTRGRAR